MGVQKTFGNTAQFRWLSSRRGIASRHAREIEMKKILLATALLAGMCGMAIAQGGAGSEPPKASDANPPAPTRAIPGEARSAPMTAAPVAMKKKKKKSGSAATNSKNRAQGSETGSAKDSAGPAGMRSVPGSGNMK
jgi:hypothetical protein